MEQHLPYWHISSSLDTKLLQIITELSSFLDEHPEGQLYPWRDSEALGETEVDRES
jgi:hypothetical protein